MRKRVANSSPIGNSLPILGQDLIKRLFQLKRCFDRDCLSWAKHFSMTWDGKKIPAILY